MWGKTPLTEYLRVVTVLEGTKPAMKDRSNNARATGTPPHGQFRRRMMPIWVIYTN